MNIANMNENKTRYFKSIDANGYSYGRFTGTKPIHAANKAFTVMMQKIRNREGDIPIDVEFPVAIKECSRGCEHKTYEYIGKRKQLDTPMKLVIGTGPDTKTIEYCYQNIMTKKSIHNNDITISNDKNGCYTDYCEIDSDIQYDENTDSIRITI